MAGASRGPVGAVVTAERLALPTKLGHPSKHDFDLSGRSRTSASEQWVGEDFFSSGITTSGITDQTAKVGVTELVSELVAMPQWMSHGRPTFFLESAPVPALGNHGGWGVPGESSDHDGPKVYVPPAARSGAPARRRFRTPGCTVWSRAHPCDPLREQDRIQLQIEFCLPPGTEALRRHLRLQ